MGRWSLNKEYPLYVVFTLTAPVKKYEFWSESDRTKFMHDVSAGNYEPYDIDENIKTLGNLPYLAMFDDKFHAEMYQQVQITMEELQFVGDDDDREVMRVMRRFRERTTK